MQTETPAAAKSRRWIWVAVTSVLVLAVICLLWARHETEPAQPMVQATPVSSAQPAVTTSGTTIYGHNLRLRQGPDFRFYVQWVRGQLKPMRAGVTPSLDNPESFYLNVDSGIIRANIGDISNYLNAQSADAPLRDIKMSGSGSQVKITGTYHKGIAIPVELSGVVKPAANNRVEIRLDKINVVKIPLKALLNSFHLTAASFLKSSKIKGLEVVGNSILFDCENLLPPPHIRGNLTSISMKNPDMEAIYGDVKKDAERVEQWRNFLRLQHGSLGFGKLTMNDVDLIMVDISQDAWFDLDLANYQQQLVAGYTRITRSAGLQIFMPDYAEARAAGRNLSIQWLKNRNAAPPNEVVPAK